MPENPEQQNTDLLNGHKEEVRTDVLCHACHKTFIALLDYSLRGNHKIECPYCRHIHYRVIEDGKITDERFGTCYENRRDHLPLRVWKADVLAMETTMASEFIRQRWLEKLT